MPPRRPGSRDPELSVASIGTKLSRAHLISQTSTSWAGLGLFSWLKAWADWLENGTEHGGWHLNVKGIDMALLSNQACQEQSVVAVSASGIHNSITRPDKLGPDVVGPTCDASSLLQKLLQGWQRVQALPCQKVSTLWYASCLSCTSYSLVTKGHSSLLLVRVQQ